MNKIVLEKFIKPAVLANRPLPRAVADKISDYIDRHNVWDYTAKFTDGSTNTWHLLNGRQLKLQLLIVIAQVTSTKFTKYPKINGSVDYTCVDFSHYLKAIPKSQEFSPKNLTCSTDTRMFKQCFKMYERTAEYKPLVAKLREALKVILDPTIKNRDLYRLPTSPSNDNSVRSFRYIENGGD